MTQTTFKTAQAMADMLADHLKLEPTTPAKLLWKLQPGYAPRLEYTVEQYTEALCEIAGINSDGKSPTDALYAIAVWCVADELLREEAQAHGY